MLDTLDFWIFEMLYILDTRHLRCWIFWICGLSCAVDTQLQCDVGHFGFLFTTFDCDARWRRRCMALVVVVGVAGVRRRRGRHAQAPPPGVQPVVKHLWVVVLNVLPEQLVSPEEFATLGNGTPAVASIKH